MVQTLRGNLQETWGSAHRPYSLLRMPLTSLSLSLSVHSGFWPLPSEECPDRPSNGGGRGESYPYPPRASGSQLGPGTPRTAEAGPGEEAGGRRGWEGRSWSEEGPRAARPDPELHRPLPAVGHASLQACEPMSGSSGPGQRAFPAQGSPLSCAPASRGIWQGFPMTSQETRQSPELCRHLHLVGDSSVGTGPWGHSPAEECTATGAWPEPLPTPLALVPSRPARLSSGHLNSSLRKDQSGLEEGLVASTTTLMAGFHRGWQRGRGSGIRGSGDGEPWPSIPSTRRAAKGREGVLQRTGRCSQQCCHGLWAPWPLPLSSTAPSPWDRELAPGVKAEHPCPSRKPGSLSGPRLPLRSCWARG